MRASHQRLRVSCGILLFCAACNINLPNATPTPPARTPRLSLTPLPTTREPIPDSFYLTEPPHPSPDPFPSPSPSPTRLAFILRQTPIPPTLPSPSPRPPLNTEQNPFRTATPPNTRSTQAPTVLSADADPISNFRATQRPTIPPTVALFVTLAPQIPQGWQLTPIVNTENDLSLRSYSIDGLGNLTGGIPADLPGAPTFVRENPNAAHPIQYAARNAVGSLYFIDRDGHAERLTVSPASIFEATDPVRNRAFIADLSWSADGERLALLIHSDFSAEDGVWWMQPGSRNPERLLVDCPRPQHPGCQIVDRRRGPYHWRTRTIQWSPDHATLIARIEISDPIQRPALALLRPGRDYNQLPPILHYDYGSWLANGDLLVSGHGPDGRNGVVILSPNGSVKQILYSDETTTLHFAREASDGFIYALGSDVGELALHRVEEGRAVAVGNPQSSPWPDFAHWDETREALDLTIGDQVISFYVNPDVAPLPHSLDGLPTGVEIGAIFTPGEQLRVISLALNLRVEPGLQGEIITSLHQDEFVRVLAGPYTTDTETWWQVQDASGRIGWLASESEGIPLLERDTAG
ncbi:MAG: SH3 domain-containing protein [Anaerolineaceae bacterium]|nr:SH3 domain-containing protein [Anaerolineaceae bacterium]